MKDINKKRGFTLLELLVVIAIVGILSAVTLAFLGDQRKRARIASTLQTLDSVRAAALICMNDNLPLGNPNCLSGPGNCPAGTAIVVGDSICTSSSVTWPVLPTGWKLVGGQWPGGNAGSGNGGGDCYNGISSRFPYATYKNLRTDGTTGTNSDASHNNLVGTFIFCAYSNGTNGSNDNTSIICTQNGCLIAPGGTHT